ncbi:MAG: chromate resistance protein [Proteobacteria bacterium]|nr:chromate resistance protein [Pseudomonadota bacterium]
MDERKPEFISPRALYGSIGTAAAPVVIDVRRAPAFDGDDKLIAGAMRRLPDDIDRWRRDLPAGRPVVVYCVRGHEVSQGAAASLRAAGIDARYLEGGLAGWVELALPTRRKIGTSPGKWVTRERPRVDRIACPWLISRFIDPEAEFLYVPASAVLETAQRTGATPYDVANVEFGHHGDHCSFDAFIRIFGLSDPALDRLTVIVRGADTGRPDLTPQSGGLVALSQGLSANFADDHAMLAHGMVVYDAFYAWCRAQTTKPA